MQTLIDKDRTVNRRAIYGMARRIHDTKQLADQHKSEAFPVTPPVTTWPCVVCGHQNPARAGSCRRCGVEK